MDGEDGMSPGPVPCFIPSPSLTELSLAIPRYFYMSISPSGDYQIDRGPADQLGTLIFPMPPLISHPDSKLLWCMRDGLRSPSFDLRLSVSLKI